MDTPQPLVPKGSDLATGPQVLLNRLMAQTQNTLLPTSGYSNRSFIWKDLESDSQMPIAGLLSPKNLKMPQDGTVTRYMELAVSLCHRAQHSQAINRGRGSQGRDAGVEHP